MLAIVTTPFDMYFIYFVLQSNIINEYGAHLLVQMKHSSIQSIPQHFHFPDFILLINIELHLGTTIRRIIFVDHTRSLKWVFDCFDLAFVFF